MATPLIDFDMDSKSDGKSNEFILQKNLVDLAIESQLSALIRSGRSDEKCTSPVTSLLDLDEEEDCFQPTGNSIVEGQLGGKRQSTNGQPTLMQIGVPATVDEVVKKNSNENVLYISSHPISWMFNFSSKKKLKAPYFRSERLVNGFKCTCEFLGIEGEGIGRNSKAAKLEAAENCLRQLNILMRLPSEAVDKDTVGNKTTIDCVPRNFVGELYEHAAKFGNDRPRFEWSEDHSRSEIHKISCFYLSYCETAFAKSKQQAKTYTASKVLEKLMEDERNTASVGVN